MQVNSGKNPSHQGHGNSDDNLGKRLPKADDTEYGFADKQPGQEYGEPGTDRPKRYEWEVVPFQAGQQKSDQCRQA